METQFVTHHGHRLAFDDTAGDGPLVLMIPGIGDLRQEYRFVVDDFVSAGYRVATMDLRGHGEADVGWTEYSVEAVAGDILRVIEHLTGGASGSAHVIATSFAAGAAVWAAAEHPDRILSLTLVGAFVHDVPMSFAKSIGAALVMNWPWRVWAWDKFYATLYPTRQPPDFAEYRARLRANLSEPGRFDANKALADAPKKASEERLPKVTAPTLVVMGSQDPDFADPRAEAEWIAARTKGEVAIIEGAGHYPHAEMPEEFSRVVLAFLDG